MSAPAAPLARRKVIPPAGPCAHRLAVRVDHPDLRAAPPLSSLSPTAYRPAVPPPPPSSPRPRRSPARSLRRPPSARSSQSFGNALASPGSTGAASASTTADTPLAAHSLARSATSPSLMSMAQRAPSPRSAKPSATLAVGLLCAVASRALTPAPAPAAAPDGPDGSSRRPKPARG